MVELKPTERDFSFWFRRKVDRSQVSVARSGAGLVDLELGKGEGAMRVDGDVELAQVDLGVAFNNVQIFGCRRKVEFHVYSDLKVVSSKTGPFPFSVEKALFHFWLQNQISQDRLGLVFGTDGGIQPARWIPFDFLKECFSDSRMGSGSKSVVVEQRVSS